MADELIKTFTDKIAEVQHIIDMYQQIIDRYKKVRTFEQSEFKRGITLPALLYANIQGQIEDIGGILAASAEIDDARLAFLVDAVTWKVKLFKEMFHESGAWTSVDVSVAGKTLTINQDVTTVIFTGVIANDDVVEITNAEDPDHNGLHTVAASGVPGVADQVLTFTQALSGSNNTTDTTMIIRLHRKA